MTVLKQSKPRTATPQERIGGPRRRNWLVALGRERVRVLMAADATGI